MLGKILSSLIYLFLNALLEAAILQYKVRKKHGAVDKLVENLESTARRYNKKDENDFNNKELEEDVIKAARDLIRGLR